MIDVIFADCLRQILQLLTQRRRSHLGLSAARSRVACVVRRDTAIVPQAN